MTDTEKCKYAKQLLQYWIDQKGHDKCWYYPDIFKALCTVFEVDIDLFTNMIVEEEFEEGCKKFRKELYQKGNSS